MSGNAAEVNKFNFSIAITTGALVEHTGASNSAAIGTLLASGTGKFANAAPYASTITAVVGGYSHSSTLSVFQTYLSSVPANDDGAAAGAILSGHLSAAQIVQAALTTVGTTTAVQDVVEATVQPQPTNVIAVVVGAVNPTTHLPYQPVGAPVVPAATLFGDLSLGAIAAGPTKSAGQVVQQIDGLIGALAPYASVGATQQPVLVSILQNAIGGADLASKNGALADIVYYAQVLPRSTPGYSAALVQGAIAQIDGEADLGASQNYIAVVAALAGDAGLNRAAIQNATYLGVMPVGSDTTAATNGANLVIDLQTNTGVRFYDTLKFFQASSSVGTSSVLAQTYAAVLVNQTSSFDVDATLAAAIKETNVSVNTLMTTVQNAEGGFLATYDATAVEVAQVASYREATRLGNTTTQIFAYLGAQISANSTLVADIASAWTVVDPDHANWVATTVGFTSPTTASSTVASVWKYAQITNATPLPSAANVTDANGHFTTTKTFPGKLGKIIDQPAAAAALTAGYVTGILESDPTFRFGQTAVVSTATQTALTSTVAQAVAASVIQSGTNLLGPTAPFNGTIPAGYTNSFRQSNGTTPTAPPPPLPPLRRLALPARSRVTSLRSPMRETRRSMR